MNLKQCGEYSKIGTINDKLVMFNLNLDYDWIWYSEGETESHGPFPNIEAAYSDATKELATTSVVTTESPRVVTPPPAPATTVCGNKYARTIADIHDPSKTIVADVYSVVTAYGCSHPIAHAVKKLLCPGSRGHKDYRTDLQEAIAAIQRELSS